MITPVRAAAAAAVLLAAMVTGTDRPPCPPGHWPQVLLWPEGHRAVVCTPLPPDPSHDQ